MLGSFFIPTTALAQRLKCNVVNRRSFDNLQTAVDAAKAGDTLTVKGTCYGTTRIFGTRKHLVIEGQSNPGHGQATLDGNNAGSILSVGDAAVVEIDGLRITNGSGRGIHNDGGIVKLTNSTVSDNTASDGSGIFNLEGTVELIDSMVSDNIPNDCVGC